MKRFLAAFLLLSMLMSATACAAEPEGAGDLGAARQTSAAAEKRVLVACFSCTGNTKGVAEKVAASVGNATLYEIVPAEPYTAADLDYNTDCRANREQDDDSARPAILGGVENWDNHDVVFLGFPIWTIGV